MSTTALTPTSDRVPLYLVLGAGPGLGLATAGRFAREGYATVLTAHTDSAATQLADTLTRDGYRAHGTAIELTDPDNIAHVVTTIATRHGGIDVLHFNPSAWREKSPLQLSVPELVEDFTLGVAALLPAIQAAHPYLSSGARILVTGSAAADKPWHRAASLGVQKAAVRNLVTSLDTTLAAQHIRAVAVQINGVLADTGPFAPDAIAEAMWQATTRRNDDWTPHVTYNG